MKKYPYYIVDVFTSTPFGGNQLAVFPHAEGLTDEGMQRIAHEFNFPETTFVLPASNPANTCRVRIFTPAREVLFAGHPTVGTACTLVYGRHLKGGYEQDLIFEEGVGPIAVAVRKADDTLLSATLTTQVKIEEPDHSPSLEVIAETLSLKESDILDGFFATVGLPYCFTRLTSSDAVDRAVLDMAAWTRHFSEAWSPNIYLFTGDVGHRAHVYARMFAPLYGVIEDPATGSAAAALVGALGNRDSMNDGRFNISITQGVALGRPSQIYASANKKDGRVHSISVEGTTVPVAEGMFYVSEEFCQ